MTDQNRSGRRRRLAITIFGVVIVLDLTLGMYHLTHRGEGSGVTELIFACLLFVAMYLLFGGRHNASTRPDRSRRAGLAIIAVMASILLFLGFYHLTHQGLPSAIIEFTMTSLLAILIYSIRRPQRD